MRSQLRWAALVVATLALSGCAKALPPLAPSAAPEEVARCYYELQARGDERAARALMWRPTRLDDVVPDRSLRGLTDLKVDPSHEDTANGRPAEYLALAELRMLVVSYTRHKRSATGEAPGHDMRFVLLGRESAGDRWLVVETGTGP